jgi:hypothetical protein
MSLTYHCSLRSQLQCEGVRYYMQSIQLRGIFIEIPRRITIALTDAYVTCSLSSGSSHSGRWVEGRLWLIVR